MFRLIFLLVICEGPLHMVIDMPAQYPLGNGPEADFLIEFFCLQIVLFAIQADDGFTRY